ncbi:MAG: NADPH-dependent 7-cyano-7-deazaguanine reductase QueF [Elusimicrobia bacterium]|nr:NADPH-dependent 7-cyano-7-deazaguanine reductase QueF [Elusimicrobiota bacterium]
MKRRAFRSTPLGYTASQARSGTHDAMPVLEAFPNQYPGYYEIKIDMPEYTAMCPKTGQPDFGTLSLEYAPAKSVVELKSLKLYLHGFRSMGIFYENVVNRFLDDVVRAVKPRWARVTGKFTPRGGISSTVTAEYPRPTTRRGGRR